MGSYRENSSRTSNMVEFTYSPPRYSSWLGLPLSGEIFCSLDREQCGSLCSVERMRRRYRVKGWALVPRHVNSSPGCLEGSPWATPANLPSSHVHTTVVVHVSSCISYVMCTRRPALRYNVIQYEILFPLPLSFSLFASVFVRLSLAFALHPPGLASLISNSIDRIVIDTIAQSDLL